MTAAGPHDLHHGRRAPRATTRGLRSPPCQPKTTLELGGPGDLRRPRPAATPSAAQPSPGHPGHDPALASSTRAQRMDLSEPSRSPTDQRHARRVGRTHGAGEPELGIQENPGRAARTRPPRRRLHDPPHPAAPPHPTSAIATDRYELAAVPAHSGQHAAAGLRLDRARGRRPLPAPSDMSMLSSSGPWLGSSTCICSRIAWEVYPSL